MVAAEPVGVGVVVVEVVAPLVAEPVEVLPAERRVEVLPAGRRVVVLAQVQREAPREEPAVLVERVQQGQVRQGLRVMALQAVQQRRQVVVVTADMEGMAAAAPVRRAV